jgi:hypothetical protein
VPHTLSLEVIRMRPSQGSPSPRYPSLPLRILIVAVLTLIVAIPVHGQGTTGTIAGKVTDQKTGEAIAGARVLLYRPGSSRVLVGSFTARDGSYRIENVPPGRFSLTATVDSHVPVRVEDVLVTVGLTTSTSFRLSEPADLSEERGVVTGSVADAATDRPIAAVNVILYQGGQPTRWGAFTDEAGDYVIINVPPGRYTLRATMVGYKVVEVENLQVVAGKTTTQPFELVAR